ncbi:MAG: glycoside hydrolase family 99-like domain-containing protein, partial [Actinomycetota bacterium]|nr:glycoside hydrolase family 99-like domain-containing protein [Actinomycetota bacterium]
RAGPHAALDYLDWTERRSSRTTTGCPNEWRANEALPFAEPSRVGVLLHAFYAELVGDLVDALRAIPVEFDLIVTNSTGSALEVDTSGLPRARNVVVLEVANHGRDIWPMVQVVNAGILDPYELVLKVHTKRSDWRAEHAELGGTGEQWRANFITNLLGDEDRVRSILGAFAEDPDLGVVTAPGSLLGPEFWGADLPLTQELLRRIELSFDPDSLQFPAGSFYWIKGFVLQGLRSLAMSQEDFEAESGQVDGTSAHAVERSVGLLSAEAGLRIAYADRVQGQVDGSWRRYRRDVAPVAQIRVVPFYLPQFHPTAENDRWWGTGFTEWTNVTAALPVYRGHNQPNLPADLGFYDLRLDEVRQAQMDLASDHGIAGFMYYYYWFTGRRLLNLPIERLAASEVDKPFCIMWANENWTRTWDGRESDILMGQDYDTVPATEFIDDVLEFLADRRYLRVDGKPILAVYRPGQMPDFDQVIKHWRTRAREAGVGEILLLSVDVTREFDGLASAKAAGLDGTLGFPPHNHLWDWVPHGGLGLDKRFTGNILSYASMVDDAQRRAHQLADDCFPGVMVNFDNTARRQWKPDLWYGSNPYTFRRWLAMARSAVAYRPPSSRVVFVNAWNEWAEGAVLEPSQRFGRTYLLAVRDVVYG